MVVKETTESISKKVSGRRYYFCSSRCLDKFTEPYKELSKLKRLLLVAICLTAPVVFLTYVPIIPSQLNHYILFAMATPVQIVIGFRFYQGTLDSIKQKTANMDVLIAIGTTMAWLYSSVVTFLPEITPYDDVYFETSAVIITLILTGSILEHRSKTKAETAVRKLFELQPRTACVLRNSKEVKIPIEQIKLNESIIVRPGEKIPTDGIIVKGRSFINQSSITGESLPVLKEEGDVVIGATINTDGLLEIRATKVGKDTVLSNIIKLVEDAKNSKVPLQRIVDKVSSYFVPVIVSIAIVSSLSWYFIGDIGLTFSLLAFVSVIIIACPCAIGIATPAALMVGSSKAAENGILIKGGENLEIARKVDTVVFDKTGTLTKGKLEVVEVVSFGQSQDEVLRLGAIAEHGSEHPLAKAILNYAKKKNIILKEPESFQAESGLGVIAEYGGHKIIVGNSKLLSKYGISIQSVKEDIVRYGWEGKTVVVVALDYKPIGAIALEDVLKENAKKTIDGLKKMGKDVVMLTGDNESTAKTIAKKLGIEKVYYDVMPNEKEHIIKDLKRNKVVAMVGDGINDAPALASADVGIAIGGGTEVAKETGGIVLISDDLSKVLVALDISNKTSTKIKQNLAWAFGYNTALVPIAAGALVPVFGPEIYSFLPFLAAGAMAFSDATVVGNSLLLGRYKPKH